MSLKQARDDGWTFVEGPAGGGTNSKRDTKVITISGATATDKIALWEKHKAGSLTRSDLEQEIAELFAHKETTSDTTLPYWDHYATSHHDAWVKNNPGDVSNAIPRP